MLPADPTAASGLLATKPALLAACRERQQAKADAARVAMEEAQASANDHNSAMEDKFESFRENCQIQRDLFARQLDEALTGLGTLHRILPDHPMRAAGLGALIRTEQGGRYFLAISLGPVPDDAGQPWLVVSTQSPIGRELLGKQVGETFTFNGQTHRIAEIG